MNERERERERAEERVKGWRKEDGKRVEVAERYREEENEWHVYIFTELSPTNPPSFMKLFSRRA